MKLSQSELIGGMHFSSDNVILDMEAGSNTEAIEQLAQRLLENEMVKPSFPSAILKREEEYCTGLTFEEMCIALPHTDAEHVLHPCIAVGTLKHPVTFQSMGEPEVPCEVEMVFMLAIKEPQAQLELLQTLMQAFQGPGRLPALKACKTPVELIELFKTYFG